MNHATAISWKQRSWLMTFVVTDKCIRCKYQDCVVVCPVDCFYEGENMLVINPSECIDCGVCEPECPIGAIIPDTTEEGEKWVEHNQKYAAQWPRITQIGDIPPDAKEWEDVPNKLETQFSPKSGGS